MADYVLPRFLPPAASAPSSSSAPAPRSSLSASIAAARIAFSKSAWAPPSTIRSVEPGLFRLCFASVDADTLDVALDRLLAVLDQAG